jgi:hypothetical protein
VNITWDPLDPILLLFEGVYIAIAIGLLLWSSRVKSEWVRATLAGLGISILGFRLLAIIPSWWLYFAEGQMGWGGQGCLEITPNTPDGIQCYKQTAKDLVVVIQNAVVLGGFVAAFVWWQKKHPKQLGPGEEKLESTGGYK